MGKVNAKHMKAAQSDLWDTPLEGLPSKDTAQGYVLLRIVSGVWEQEHRMVLAQKLGRALMPGESVHHIDGNRKNNAPENLELWVTPQRAGQRAHEIMCPHCGCAYA